MKGFLSHLRTLLLILFGTSVVYLVNEATSGVRNVYACYGGHIYCGVSTIGSAMRFSNTVVVMFSLCVQVVSLFLIEKKHVKKVDTRFLYAFMERLFASGSFFVICASIASIFTWSLDEKYVLVFVLYVFSVVLFSFYDLIKRKVYIFLK